jgi:hypothetical protein
MRRVALVWAAVLAGAALLGCGEECVTHSRTPSGAIAVATPEGLVTKLDRCSYAVREVAAEQLDCSPHRVELHPVGPRAFLASGCDAYGTFLCDDEGDAPAHVRRGP